TPRRLTSSTTERVFGILKFPRRTQVLSETLMSFCTGYLVSVETASWERGWQDCTSRGADLVIVDRAEEQVLIIFLHLEQTFLTKIAKKDTWIGLMDRDQEGSWKWSDGTPLTLAFWWTGQPDNGGGHPKYGEEDCAVITANMGTDKNWNDLRCDASRPWICEKNAN
uniref:C-type lectin domain-containing protein n=1 Tax=Scophthalmus maximus TaxID=52904 RepID=A0A8D3E616_SCOMX